MTKLAITNKGYSDCGTAMFHGQNLYQWRPDAIAMRIERAMGWFLGQPGPHTIILDDPSGIAPAFIVAWLMTNSYAATVVLAKANEKPIGVFGISEDGHARYTAFTGGE